MNREELCQALEDSGLTQYEADAYVAVVELGTASAVEIADACGVPQARIYDVLRNLQSKEYVETYQQGSLRARAHDPSKVLADLHTYAESVVDAAAEIEERWERPVVENHMVSVVKRFETVFERTKDRIDAAENEVWLAVTPTHFRALLAHLRAALERDVVVKLTITPEADRAIPIEELAPEFEGAATEVRYRTLLTPFIGQFDRISISFAPEQTFHPANEYGVLVNDYSLARVFDWYLQTALWEPWEVVYSTRNGELPVVYTTIRECLRDIEPFVEDGHEVTVTVVGQDRTSRENRELTGRVLEVSYTRQPDDVVALDVFVEEATLLLETAEGTVEVGGWGALYEQFEARRITVEAIE